MCPIRDSSPGKTVKITYRLQACSEPVRRVGYYRELTVPGIRPFSPHYRPIIGSFAYHFQVVSLSSVVTPGRHFVPLGGHAGVWIAGKTLTWLEYPGDARPIVLRPSYLRCPGLHLRRSAGGHLHQLGRQGASAALRPPRAFCQVVAQTAATHEGGSEWSLLFI